MNSQPISTANVEAFATVSAALTSAVYSVKKGLQVIIGSDTIDQRSLAWNQASQQKTYIGAFSKRVTLILGSDSLMKRLTNIAKAALAAVSAVLFFDIAKQIHEGEHQRNGALATVHQYQQRDLSDLKIAKEVAGNAIEHCWKNEQLNAAAGVLNSLVPCLLTYISNQNESHQSDLNLLQRYLNNSATASESLEKQVSRYESENKALKHKLEQAQGQSKECENSIQSRSVNQLAESMAQNMAVNQELSSEVSSLRELVQHLVKKKRSSDASDTGSTAVSAFTTSDQQQD